MRIALDPTLHNHCKSKYSHSCFCTALLRFNLADRPYSEEYQFSCKGRMREYYIFAGQIVPILNRMLRASGYSGEDKDKKRKSL